jgi:hypothetical protein
MKTKVWISRDNYLGSPTMIWNSEPAFNGTRYVSTPLCEVHKYGFDNLFSINVGECKTFEIKEL